MASSGSFSFGCSAAVPLLPTPSFSFPSQPAASSFPFTNEPAPMPLCILPPHLVRFPRPLCLLGSPLCCPALLPEKLFSRPLCWVCPCAAQRFSQEASQGPCAFWVCPCTAQCSPCGCLSLGPCAWWVCLPPVAVSFHGHTSGTQTPAPCARPLTGPCPASDHAFPSASGLSEDLASSASPSVCAPARSPEGRAPCVVEIFAGLCNFSSTAVSMHFQSVAVDHVPAKRWHVLQLDLREPGAQQLLRCCRPWWYLHPRAALLPARGIFQPTAMGNALRTRSVRASIQTVCLHFKAMTSLG